MLAPYQRVLARRGVPALTLAMIWARLPLAAAPVVITLHVVLELHRGWGAAGLVGSAFALGSMVGSPLMGRALDKKGLRPVITLTTLVETLFWLLAPTLPYPLLVVSSVVAGLLALPVYSLARQALSAMVPPHERRAAFALDSMSVEISYAVGPAAGIALLGAWGGTPALWIIGGMILLAGVALFVLDPVVHSDDTRLAPEDRAPREHHSASPRTWLTRPVAALLVVTMGSTFVVLGTETSLTAQVTSLHAVHFLGLVIAGWCLASLLGGFLLGASHRKVTPLALLAALAVTAAPVGLATSWPLVLLFVLPTGMFCAPVMAAGAEALSAQVPPGVRGTVLGVHSAALTAGSALATPLAGLVVDAWGVKAAYALTALGGLLVVLVAWLLGSKRLVRRSLDSTALALPTQATSPEDALVAALHHSDDHR